VSEGNVVNCQMWGWIVCAIDGLNSSRKKAIRMLC